MTPLSSRPWGEEGTSVETRLAASARALHPTPRFCAQERRGHTVDDPGHAPQPEQDEQAQSLELVLLEHEDDVEDKRNHHDDGVQDFKLVVEELQAENKYFEGNLHHKEGQDGYAQVVEHLEGMRRHSESRQSQPGAGHTDRLALSAPAGPPERDVSP